MQIFTVTELGYPTEVGALFIIIIIIKEHLYCAYY